MQLLFKYPPAKKLTLRMKDLAPFCFPEGVKVCLMLFYMLRVVKVFFFFHFNCRLTNCSLFLSNVCIWSFWIGSTIIACCSFPFLDFLMNKYFDLSWSKKFMLSYMDIIFINGRWHSKSNFDSSCLSNVMIIVYSD